MKFDIDYYQHHINFIEQSLNGCKRTDGLSIEYKGFLIDTNGYKINVSIGGYTCFVGHTEYQITDFLKSALNDGIQYVLWYYPSKTIRDKFKDLGIKRVRKYSGNLYECLEKRNELIVRFNRKDKIKKLDVSIDSFFIDVDK